MTPRSLRFRKSEKKIPDEVSVGYRPKPTLNKATFLLLAAASFYEGTAFQRNADTNGSSTIATSSSSQSQTSSSGGSGMQTGSFMHSHIIGQVATVSDKSITVQDQRTGNNTTLTINGSTQIEVNGQAASASDIQSGDLVVVTKTSNTSNIAAKIIAAPGDWGDSGTTDQSNTGSPLQGLNSN
jgi:hypothetical protein